MKEQTKNTCIETCPIHFCSPAKRGKNDTIRLPWGEMACGHYCDFGSDCSWNFSYSTNLDYEVYCPECAKKNPFAPKYNKFGAGFSSRYSMSAAVANWNKACKRYMKHAIKDVLNGKTINR